MYTVTASELHVLGKKIQQLIDQRFKFEVKTEKIQNTDLTWLQVEGAWSLDKRLRYKAEITTDDVHQHDLNMLKAHILMKASGEIFDLVMDVVCRKKY